MLLGVAGGIYFGVIWGFIGGIIQLIESVHPEINAVGIAWGLARIFVLAPLCGWGAVVIGMILGEVFLES